MAPTVRPKTDRRRQSAVPPLAADSVNDGPRVSESDIALRAFAYYCERGCQHGADVDDWLRAERELLGAPKAPKRRSVRSSTAS
jgi:hypothetical protein